MKTGAVMVCPAVSLGSDSGGYLASHTSITTGCFLSDLQSDFHAGPMFFGCDFGQQAAMRITAGVGREVKGIMIYFSLERCETLFTRNQQPVAV